MACTSCGKKKPVAIEQRPMAMIELSSGYTDKRTGQLISSREPLVMATPPGGWVILFSINGVSLSATGRSPQESISAMRRLMVDNGKEWDEDKAWMDANIQWLNITNPKFHRIQIESVPTAEPAERSARQSHDPSEWGSVAWRYLGLLLAKDRYNPSELIGAMKWVTDLLNPKSNPSLGCPDCHREASIALSHLQANPPPNLAAARRWLVDFHNSVNKRLEKPELDFQQASEQNFWN